MNLNVTPNIRFRGKTVVKSWHQNELEDIGRAAAKKFDVKVTLKSKKSPSTVTLTPSTTVSVGSKTCTNWIITHEKAAQVDQFIRSQLRQKGIAFTVIDKFEPKTSE